MNRSFCVVSLCFHFSSPMLDMDSFSSKMLKDVKIQQDLKLTVSVCQEPRADCSFGLMWVGYFLLLLQHLLQTWLRLFSTVVTKHLELLYKKLVKKKRRKVCFEPDTHTSFKSLLGIQISKYLTGIQSQS